MGCFCISGYHSHLPICENDKCFGLLGFLNKDALFENDYGCGEVLVPICLPIFGEYDEYGSLKNITHDQNIEILEKIFNKSINDLINEITHEIFDHDKYFPDSKYKLVLTIDHEFVYDEISSINFNMDFETSYLISDLANNIFSKFFKKDVYNGEFVEETYNDIPIITYDGLFYRLKRQFNKVGYIENIHPKYIQSFRTYSPSLLSLYQNSKYGDIIFSNMKENLIKFFSFIQNSHFLSFRIVPHLMCGQNGYEYTDKLKDYYKHINNFIEKRIEKII